MKQEEWRGVVECYTASLEKEEDDEIKWIMSYLHTWVGNGQREEICST